MRPRSKRKANQPGRTVRDLSLRGAMIGEAFLDVPVNTPIKRLIDDIAEPCVGPVDQFFGARSREHDFSG
jgi:hypothetical protein